MGVTKRFGSETAVDGVDLTVPSGSIVALIGPSGCGKTTTVRLLLGNYRPTEGRVELLGTDPVVLSSRQRRRIGYLPQLPILFPSLTLWENLNYTASLYGMGLRRRARLRNALELTELTGHERKRVDEVSGGMQRRLALAATLAHEPEVVFLDEPTAGIDPILRRKFWDHFREQRDAGRTFLVTTQYVAEAMYCDFVGVLSDGRLIALDPPEELRRKALGGELIDACATIPIPDDLAGTLARLPFVTGQVSRTGLRSVQLAVADASTALPDLMAWFDAHGIGLESAGEHTTDYDEVFVRLIEADRAAHARPGDEAA
jgi:ABC-2 type transport system ATP-binding protein